MSVLPEEWRPIFIVGMPRSGTSLLSAMLSAHPRLAISPESHLLSKWRLEYGPRALDSSEGFDRFWKAYTEYQSFKHFGLDPDLTRQRILSIGPPSWKHTLMGLVQAYGENMDMPRFGEKTPGHFEHLGDLLTWFPNARVLFLVRDPRAVTASMIRVPWGHDLAHLHARKWRESVAILDSYKSDGRVLLVQYEHVIQKQEETLRAICKHIEEDYDPCMLRPTPDTSPLINRTEWATEHLNKTHQPVTNESLEKWRKQLTPYQTAIVEWTTRTEMARFGLEPATRGLSLAHRIQYLQQRGVHFGRRIKLLLTNPELLGQKLRTT
jgi:hypothetical protein